MDFHEPLIPGRPGMKVGRLGLAGGYGAPAAAFEEAFERSCNYFLLENHHQYFIIVLPNLN